MKDAIKIKLLSAMLAIFLGESGVLVGQQAILPGGGDGMGENISLYYSIGQIAQNDMAGNLVSLIEGVQQPFEISVSTLDDLTGIRVSGCMYPNPASDIVTIELDTEAPLEHGALILQLLDVNGRILLEERLTEEIRQIGINHIPDGYYVIRISARGGDVLNFKLTKH